MISFVWHLKAPPSCLIISTSMKHSLAELCTYVGVSHLGGIVRVSAGLHPVQAWPVQQLHRQCQLHHPKSARAPGAQSLHDGGCLEEPHWPH